MVKDIGGLDLHNIFSNLLGPQTPAAKEVLTQTENTAENTTENTPENVNANKPRQL